MMCKIRCYIICVCSNADIAAQNIRKLNITGSESPSFATRLSLLMTMPEMLMPTVHEGSKPTTFVAFTPGTSFQSVTCSTSKPVATPPNWLTIFSIIPTPTFCCFQPLRTSRSRTRRKPAPKAGTTRTF